MKHQNIYTEIAEDLIEIVGDNFNCLLCLRLLTRSAELPTAAKPEVLLADVCQALVRDNFGKLITFRTQKYGACHMQTREIEMVAEALKPFCVRAWPTLNVILTMDRDNLFQPRDYTTVMGNFFIEEAASVTFVRFLNDMQRLKESHSETYDRNVSRISQVHALNRVANVMPSYFHKGHDGKLEAGQSVEAAKWSKVLSLREMTGIHTMDDLLAEAGLS